MVASGTVAMYMDNIGAVTSNLEGVIDVGTALYPGKDGIADVGMGGWNLAIPATAENPKGAAIFIDKVTNAEAMELQLKLPALAASLQDEQWTQGINAAYSEMLSSHVRELPPVCEPGRCTKRHDDHAPVRDDRHVHGGAGRKRLQL